MGSIHHGIAENDKEENRPVFHVTLRTRSLVIQKEAPMSQPSTVYYAVLREGGEHWNAQLPMRQQERWEEHAAFMDALADHGSVVLGGPLDDEKHTVLLIFAAGSTQSVESRLAEDPWTAMGVLRTVWVKRWEILLKERK
jgi:uncharacterized protein YciI